MRLTKKIAIMGLLTALAFGLSYLELLIPFSALGIPGVKLGLANLVVMLALYTLGRKEAAVISLVRITLSFFIFGNLTSLLYSLAGGALSFIVMLILYDKAVFSKIGVSISGAAAHNIGQIIAASFLLGTNAIFYYLPFLLLCAILTGLLNGVLLSLILKRLLKIGHK